MPSRFLSFPSSSGGKFDWCVPSLNKAVVCLPVSYCQQSILLMVCVGYISLLIFVLFDRAFTVYSGPETNTKVPSGAPRLRKAGLYFRW